MSEWKEMIKISAALPALEKTCTVIPDDFTVGDNDIYEIQNCLDSAHLLVRNEITNKVLKYKQALISSSDKRYNALLDDLRSDKERLVKDSNLLHSKLVDSQHANELLDKKNQIVFSNIIQFYQRNKVNEITRLFMERLKMLHEKAKYNKRLAASAYRKRMYQLKKVAFHEFYKYAINSKYTKRISEMKSESEININDLQSRLELQERIYQQKISEDKLLYDRECQRHASIEEELKSKVLNTLTNLKLDALSVFANKDADHSLDAENSQRENAYSTPIKIINKNVYSDESPSSVVLGASTPKSINYRSPTIVPTKRSIIGRK